MNEQSASETVRDQFIVSCDKSLLDLDVIYAFLSTCYWSQGIARSRVERAIEHSLCFGVYDRTQARRGAAFAAEQASRPVQVGFARVVTDCASFAYVCDVFVIESQRGKGLSKQLMGAIIAHPSLQGIRRFCLLTRDAHGLYEQFGFQPMRDPSRYLEVLDTDSYKREVSGPAKG